PALDFVGAARLHEPSAPSGLQPGAFRSVADAIGKDQTQAITKLAKSGVNGKGSGLGLLSLGAWILSNIDDAQAQPVLPMTEPLDWDTIGPQDLAFGKFVITTLDGQVLFSDNPFVSIVIKIVGGTATVQTIQNSPSRMADLLFESRTVFGNFATQ